MSAVVRLLPPMPDAPRFAAVMLGTLAAAKAFKLLYGRTASHLRQARGRGARTADAQAAR
jgi:hypothetical protein